LAYKRLSGDKINRLLIFVLLAGNQ